METPPPPPTATRIIATRPADTVAWARRDLLGRLVPFTLVVAATWLWLRPAWLGLTAGFVPAQVGFGLGAGVLLFGAATLLQIPMSRRRGAVAVPNGRDAWLQAGYYVLNAPIEEAVFRGLVQGGLGVLLGAPAGMIVGTALYVGYHRLGGWPWQDVLATALVGVPLALAFYLLPGPPSLLGVSIAHAFATCGYLGVGPYLLRRLGWL